MWLKYVLTYNSIKVTTTFSLCVEHAWTVPFKIKSGNEMVTAIAKIIRDDRRCPKNLQINMEKEFYNTNVFLKKYNINHYLMYGIPQ